MITCGIFICVGERYKILKHPIRGSVGTGRRARLRILWWLHRVGSSPIFRTKDSSLFALSGKLLFFLKWEFSLIQLPMWFAEYSEEFAGDVLDNSVKKCLESYSGREQRM